MKRAKTGEIFKKVRTLDEIYTPNIRVTNPVFYEGVYNKDKFKALIVSPNIETTVPRRADMDGISNIMFIKKDIPINTAKNGLNMIKSNIYRSSEPIGGGGGGGGSLMTRELIKANTQAYLGLNGFKGKMGLNNIEQSEPVLRLEKALDNSPNLWIVSPFTASF